MSTHDADPRGQPLNPDIAVAPESRKSPLVRLAQFIAQPPRFAGDAQALDNGERAALARLDPEGDLRPHQVAALVRAFVATNLEPETWKEETWQRWVLIAHGMALAGHDEGKSLGQQLSEADVAESRVTKLLTARGEAFRQLLAPIAPARRQRRRAQLAGVGRADSLPRPRRSREQGKNRNVASENRRPLFLCQSQKIETRLNTGELIMPLPRFIQIHTLHTYPAALLNRDDAGLAKRLPLGNTVRTRISSQCLKRHWRVAEDQFALSRLGVPMAARSRIFTDKILENMVGSGVKSELAEILALT